MKSDHGEFELEVPRDRNGNFVPQEYFLTSFRAARDSKKESNEYDQ